MPAAAQMLPTRPAAAIAAPQASTAKTTIRPSRRAPLQPAGRHGGERRAGGDRRVEQAGAAGAGVVDGQREDGEQGAGHPEGHRDEVDHEAAEEGVVGADEAQALADRREDRVVSPTRPVGRCGPIARAAATSARQLTTSTA